MNRDPATDRHLNFTFKFINTMLSIHKQDQWNKFLDSHNFKDCLFYEMNKQLLHKRPITHSLFGPNSFVFSANEKAELMVDSLVHQFTPNPGPHLPEV